MMCVCINATTSRGFYIIAFSTRTECWNEKQVMSTFLLFSSVLGYLVMFRLEELGMDQFKKLIGSQPPTKTLKVYTCLFELHVFVNVTIIKFLRFLFNESNLMGWIENEVNGSLLIHIALYKMPTHSGAGCMIKDMFTPQSSPLC